MITIFINNCWIFPDKTVVKANLIATLEIIYANSEKNNYRDWMALRINGNVFVYYDNIKQMEHDYERILKSMHV